MLIDNVQHVNCPVSLCFKLSSIHQDMLASKLAVFPASQWASAVDCSRGNTKGTQLGASNALTCKLSVKQCRSC